MTYQSTSISINEASEAMQAIHGLLAVLVGFREREGERIREWDDKGSGCSLCAELAGVVSEADSLIRLINSIIDGTDEQLPISELQSRFNGLQRTANMLLTQWKSTLSKGIGR